MISHAPSNNNHGYCHGQVFWIAHTGHVPPSARHGLYGLDQDLSYWRFCTRVWLRGETLTPQRTIAVVLIVAGRVTMKLS
nr:hypothetical protein [Labrenzia sp. PHM005]